MKRDEIIHKLTECEVKLRRAHGVIHVACSDQPHATRNGNPTETRPAAIMTSSVDLESKMIATMFDYAGVKQYIAGLINAPADVVDRIALKPHVRRTAIACTISAF